MALKKKRTKKKAIKKSIVKRKAIKKPTVKRKAIKNKAVKKRPAKKKAAAVVKKSKEVVIGTVTHYFPKVRAAVIKLKTGLNTGDKIRVKGHTTDFTQSATSMQIDRVPINSAKKGQEIGLLVDSRVRQNDVVYKA